MNTFQNNTKHIIEIKDLRKSYGENHVLNGFNMVLVEGENLVIMGKSGSGKTNILINILTNENLLKNYFHYTVVFSPTAGKYDDSYKPLNLPSESFKTDFSADDLNTLIENRKNLIDSKKYVSLKF